MEDPSGQPGFPGFVEREQKFFDLQEKLRTEENYSGLSIIPLTGGDGVLSDHKTANFEEEKTSDHMVNGPQYDINESKGSRPKKSRGSNIMSEDSGYPRSQIRSQDRQRVENFLQRKDRIKDDDPLTKFTLYQSYRQLKSGQSQRKSTEKTQSKNIDTTNTHTRILATAGAGDLDNLDALFEVVKRSVSPEMRDEPQGMIQGFENIQIQQNLGSPGLDE